MGICAFSMYKINQEQAISGLIELMKHLPHDTTFFINAWTWGYEDILKAIARAFQCQIHVDRYKFSIYQHQSDPFLRSLMTTDASATRFHACERFHRCEHVAVENEPTASGAFAMSRTGKRVIYVNPLTMGIESWELYQRDTKQRICRDETINTLLVPLSRHSSLPELQAFVSLFKPRKIVPNTLDPRLHGLDWSCINQMFEPCLSHPDMTNSLPPIPTNVDDLDKLSVQVDEDGDAALKNIVGSMDAALRWADRAKLRNKLEIMIGYLDPHKKSFLSKLLRVPGESPAPTATYALNLQLPNSPKLADSPSWHDKDSGEESDGHSEDEHWRTAHLLFASPTSAEGEKYKWCFSSPKSQGDDDVMFERPAPQAQDTGAHFQRLAMTAGDPVATLSPSTPLTHPNRKTTLKHTLQGREYSHGRKQLPKGDDPHHPPLSRKRFELETRILGSPIRMSPLKSKLSRRVASQKQTPVKRNVDVRSPKGPLLESNKNHAANVGSVHATSERPQCTRDVTLNAPFFGHSENIFVLDQVDNSPSSKIHHSGVMQRQSPNYAAYMTVAPVPGSADHSRPKAVATYHTSSKVLDRKRRIECDLKTLELAERLARANPNRVVPTYREARARLLKRCTRGLVKNQYLEALQTSDVQNVIPDPHFDRSLANFAPVEGSQIDMDWDRSRRIVEEVRAELANGRWPVFPGLVSAES
ncbi:hypothetical protein AX17_003104 [Amanita inopinata Kibby_2008]|nr:hypothetical protein AX17_003104 [Amanita inopinata Kibby_2008]